MALMHQKLLGPPEFPLMLVCDEFPMHLIHTAISLWQSISGGKKTFSNFTLKPFYNTDVLAVWMKFFQLDTALGVHVGQSPYPFCLYPSYDNFALGGIYDNSFVDSSPLSTAQLTLQMLSALQGPLFAFAPHEAGLFPDSLAQQWYLTMSQLILSHFPVRICFTLP